MPPTTGGCLRGSPLAERHLHSVDVETGQILEDCPACEEYRRQLEGAEKEIRAWRARYANLKRDKEAEAKEHDLFPIAKRLFGKHRKATGHTRTAFSADRFWLCAPFIEKYGEPYIERAIEGIAYDPHRASKPNRRGKIEVYDHWENLFKSPATLQRYHDRAPLDRTVAIFEVELPPGEKTLMGMSPLTIMTEDPR